MMGESKDTQLNQLIADDAERRTDEPFSEDRKILITAKGHPIGCECATCMTAWKNSQYDPDYLNPAKGGNKAGDDYW